MSEAIRVMQEVADALAKAPEVDHLRKRELSLGQSLADAIEWVRNVSAERDRFREEAQTARLALDVATREVEALRSRVSWFESRERDLMQAEIK